MNFVEVSDIPLKDRSLNLPIWSELKENIDLGKEFRKLHNYIFANDGLSGTETFEEILKLLFVKIYDETYPQGTHVIFGISETEYTQIMKGKKNTFESRIGDLFEKTRMKFFEIFHKSEIIKLKLTTLAFVVGQLQHFNLSKSKRDVKGLAFQKFLYNHQRGNRGQFLTPEPIITLAVNMLKPKSHEKIIDPACGTGGFLDEIMNYIREKEFINIKSIDERKIIEENYGRYMLRGLDINKTMTRVVKMRMILKEINLAGIMCIDSLKEWKIIDHEAKKNKIIGSIKPRSFDLIFTNPPFGTQGKIKDKSYLKRFQLGYKWKKKEGSVFAITSQLQNSQVPNILFIERCIDFLKDEGRLAIVLPWGDFQNTTLKYVRDYIFKNMKILAVISLPATTFIPHGTGIKTGLLLLKKKNQNELKKEINKDYEIFFSIIKKVGYEGNKNGTPMYIKDIKGEYIKDKSGNLVLDEDISYVFKAYEKFLKIELDVENNKAFIRKYSELENRIDPEFYKPKFKKLRADLKSKGAIPLNSLVRIVSKKAEKLADKEAVVNYIEISNINSEFSEIHSYTQIKVHDLPSRASYEIKTGDVITAVSGISTGTQKHASAFVTSDFDGCICTNGLKVLRPINIDPYYLLCYFKSDYFLSQMLQFRTGAAIPAVSDENIKKVLVLLPDNKIIKIISDKIKKSYELRNQAKESLIESNKILESFINTKEID